MTIEEVIEQLEKAYKECIDLGQTCGKDSVFWKRAEAIKVAIKVLKQEPTGHWITGRSTYHDVEMYRCSECKNWSHYKAEKCPNCHVRMVERESKVRNEIYSNY